MLAFGLAQYVVDWQKEGEWTIPKAIRLQSAEIAALTLCETVRALLVVNGTAYPSVKSSTPGIIYPGPPVPAGEARPFCWRPAGAREPSFCDVDMDWPTTLGWYLHSQYMGSRARKYWREDGVLKFDSENESDSWEAPDLYTSSYYTFRQIEARGLGEVMKSLAAALNNLTHARSGDRATGGFDTYPRVLQVRWWWLVLPFAFEVLGASFLVLEIFRKRRVAGLWKDSILAVLYHGLSDDPSPLGEMETLGEMREAARFAQTRLQKAGGSSGRVCLGPQG
ncbi:hypothetical protein B0T16DRAFT_407370 [Cercophora newfieldiana]|uniref:Uncharacterized protein n=1 Tax=Cercophora newfieldiana TaxID=92897 RepID=A0AA39YK88_9PEZI|nr:hypothetical protein B0T16DRAFT_407370 [Cercophora newfieldiana]